MTKRMLQIRLSLVITSLILLLVAAIATDHFLQQRKIYETVKDFSNFIIAIAAAYLAYSFQRRQTFLASLRHLWHELVEAKAALIDYTHNLKPDQIAYSAAHRSLSKAIDTVRSVY